MRNFDEIRLFMEIMFSATKFSEKEALATEARKRNESIVGNSETFVHKYVKRSVKNKTSKVSSQKQNAPYQIAKLIILPLKG